jgi:hypothetical protein
MAGWSDNPTDHDQPFRISGNDFTILFEASGTTIFFSSRVQTKWELKNCRVVEMTFTLEP